MKHLKYIYGTCFFVLFFCSSYGQDGFSKFFRYEEDSARRMNMINNLAYDSIANEIFFCLNTYAYSISPIVTWCVLTKIDIHGNILRQRLDTFSNANNEYDVVLESRDKQSLYWGGFVYDYQISDSTTMDFLITKTDKDLNHIWRKRYVNPGIQIGYVQALTEDKDGNVTMLGTKATYWGGVYPGVPDRIYLMKIDSSGNVLWEKTVGENNYNGQVYYNNGTSLLQDDQTGYLAAGRTYSYGEVNGTPFAIKADAQRNETWHQFYMQDYYTGIVLGTTKTKEANTSYVHVGQVAPGPNSHGVAFVNKTDGNGNELWNKSLQRTPFTHCFWDVTNAADNSDVIVCGSTKIDFYPASPPNKASKGWLVRFDQDGNEIWNRMITHDPDFNSNEYLYRTVALKDGSILAVGSSNGIDSRGNNTQAGWVLKVNGQGCLYADCRDVGIGELEEAGEAVAVYPNPAKGFVSIRRERPFRKGAIAVLTDLSGRELKDLPSPAGKSRMEYDFSGLRPGVYILQIIEDGKKTQKKITLL